MIKPNSCIVFFIYNLMIIFTLFRTSITNKFDILVPFGFKLHAHILLIYQSWQKRAHVAKLNGVVLKLCRVSSEITSTFAPCILWKPIILMKEIFSWRSVFSEEQTQNAFNCTQLNVYVTFPLTSLKISFL